MSLTAKDHERLFTCRKELQALFARIALTYPCAILEGHRDEQAQMAAFNAGKSQLPWPKGKHNSLPSFAVDVAPLPINWRDREAFAHFAGFVLGIADCMGYTIRWGGDWDMDRSLANNRFDDLVHFELILPEPTKPPTVQV